MSSIHRQRPSVSSNTPVCPEAGPRLFTVGHSTRTVDELIALISESSCDLLVDIRRFPQSRRFPWFEGERLREVLGKAGIAYVWEGEALGGKRSLSAHLSKLHPGLRSPSFKAYAAHIVGPSGAPGLQRLYSIVSGGSKTPVVMCAERLWFRCHRMVLSDAFTLAGVEVFHLVDLGRSPVRHDPSPGCRQGCLGLIEYETPKVGASAGRGRAQQKLDV